MKFKVQIAAVSVLLMLISLSMLPVPARGQDVIRVGEPLHLYIRRQPVQDVTYLFFHPPDDIYESKSWANLSYRKTLLAKGTGQSSEVMYFPQDPNSNFLQFEPNSSIPFTYNFTIAAIRPIDLSDVTYILNVKIDIDHERDRKYDKVISFDIEGTADSDVHTLTGTVPVDTDKLKKFDWEEGGRLRINISRKDNIQTSVTIYCGYHGYNSYLVLPYSKYKYSPDDGNGQSIWPWALAGGGLLVIAAAGYFYFKQKQEEKRPPEPPKKKGARRRK